MDNMVVMAKTWDAYTSSRPYCRENRMPMAAAGQEAASTPVILTTSGRKRKRLARMNRTGMSTSLYRDSRNTWEP